MPKRTILIGTSAWIHKEWGEKFYPKNIEESPLAFYSRRFKTVEINSSFYHLPTAETFSEWRRNSRSGFLFAVKIGRYLTHRKKLILDADSRPYLNLFLKNSQELKTKLAAILIQLPPSFSKNLERLEAFLKYLNNETKKLKYKPRVAVEFRHDSWLDPETFEILKRYAATAVISSTADIRKNTFTTDFTYIRMRSSKEPSAKDIERDLENLKKEIDGYSANVKKIFIYFNKNYSEYAIGSAEYLISLFERKK